MLTCPWDSGSKGSKWLLKNCPTVVRHLEVRLEVHSSLASKDNLFHTEEELVGLTRFQVLLMAVPDDWFIASVQILS